jgi:hypothetical protein
MIMMMGGTCTASSEGSGGDSNNHQHHHPNQLEEVFGEEQSHDDFFALHASRHNERQWARPSLRVKRSVYIVMVLSFCAFTSKLSSISIASMKGEYVNASSHHVDRSLNLTVDIRTIIEPNLSLGQRWNSSSQHEASASEQKNINLGETKPIQLHSDTKASRHIHIWIDVISYAEGIAGWKTSLLELLHLAQTINATLVEPCMKSGRLRSCRGDKNKIPVSEIFDFAKYMSPSNGKEFPLLASYDNYQAALDDSDSDAGIIKLCLLNNLKLPIEERCSADTTRVRGMKRNVVKHVLDKTTKDNFILHMEDYWRGSLDDLGWQLGIDDFPAVTEFEGKIIPFHSEHLQFVDDLLQRGNITRNNFSAIHWRAEKLDMNFTRCAIAVNDVKRIMLKNMSNNKIAKAGDDLRHKFVLMSSLNENEDMMWSNSRNSTSNDTTSSQLALRYLLRDNGFIKIDDLLENEDKLLDSGMLAVYDLIIASKANNFASCVKNGEVGCNKSSQKLCEKCNHVGKFGQLATLFRQENVNDVGSSWGVGQLNNC